MIKLEHLNKTFGNHQALTDINTEFKEHQTTVIVGPRVLVNQPYCGH